MRGLAAEVGELELGLVEVPRATAGRRGRGSPRGAAHQVELEVPAYERAAWSTTLALQALRKDLHTAYEGSVQAIDGLAGDVGPRA